MAFINERGGLALDKARQRRLRCLSGERKSRFSSQRFGPAHIELRAGCVIIISPPGKLRRRPHAAGASCLSIHRIKFLFACVDQVRKYNLTRIVFALSAAASPLEPRTGWRKTLNRNKEEASESRRGGDGLTCSGCRTYRLQQHDSDEECIAY